MNPFLDISDHPPTQRVTGQPPQAQGKRVATRLGVSPRGTWPGWLAGEGGPGCSGAERAVAIHSAQSSQKRSTGGRIVMSSPDSLDPSALAQSVDIPEHIVVLLLEGGQRFLV